MKKLIVSFLFVFIIFTIFQLPSEARKYVMTITPVQEISTKEETLSKGDIISFEVTNDVYVNERLFIAKGTPVNATVGYVEGNAWIGETPLLTLSYFETKDVTGDPVVIEYTLNIKGKYGMNKFPQYAKYYTKSILFCANLDIKPKSLEFNVLFDKE